MNLENKLLPEWLKTVPDEYFPHYKKIDLYTQYKKLKDYLLENVHKEVTIGANLKDPDMLLNDHGPDHIETVISRASYLVDDCSCNLTPYEVYFLLCCIELHDVGNIFGRYNHEQNADSIMTEARGICGKDTVEAITIKKIAESHGGKLANGNKDKITYLEETTETFYGTIRPRLIASILRFADELADDKTRSYKKLLIQGKLPKKSEVFHAYAMCLESVKIDHKESSIKLNFQIPDNFLKKTFGKLDEEIFLIDEIYERLLKMHIENTYCMRFTKNQFNIEKIRADINFYNAKELKYTFPRMTFNIEENGYPQHKWDIFKMCPELISDGCRLDGNYFFNKQI